MKKLFVWLACVSICAAQAVSIGPFATETWVEDKIKEAESVTNGLASVSYVDDLVSDVEDKIPDVSGLATKEYVDAVSNAIPDTSMFSTIEYVNATSNNLALLIDDLVSEEELGSSVSNIVPGWALVPVPPVTVEVDPAFTNWLATTNVVIDDNFGAFVSNVVPSWALVPIPPVTVEVDPAFTNWLATTNAVIGRVAATNEHYIYVGPDQFKIEDFSGGGIATEQDPIFKSWADDNTNGLVSLSKLAFNFEDLAGTEIPAGTLVVKDNTLYKTIISHTGAWNPQHFTTNNAVVQEAIDYLRSDVRGVYSELAIVETELSNKADSTNTIPARYDEDGDSYHVTSGWLSFDAGGSESVSILPAESAICMETGGDTVYYGVDYIQASDGGMLNLPMTGGNGGTLIVSPSTEEDSFVVNGHEYNLPGSNATLVTASVTNGLASKTYVDSHQWDWSTQVTNAPAFVESEVDPAFTNWVVDPAVNYISITNQDRLAIKWRKYYDGSFWYDMGYEYYLPTNSVEGPWVLARTNDIPAAPVLDEYAKISVFHDVMGDHYIVSNATESLRPVTWMYDSNGNPKISYRGSVGTDYYYEYPVVGWIAHVNDFGYALQLEYNRYDIFPVGFYTDKNGTWFYAGTNREEHAYCMDSMLQGGKTNSFDNIWFNVGNGKNRFSFEQNGYFWVDGFGYGGTCLVHNYHSAQPEYLFFETNGVLKAGTVATVEDLAGFASYQDVTNVVKAVTNLADRIVSGSNEAYVNSSGVYYKYPDGYTLPVTLSFNAADDVLVGVETFPSNYTVVINAAVQGQMNPPIPAVLEGISTDGKWKLLTTNGSGYIYYVDGSSLYQIFRLEGLGSNYFSITLDPDVPVVPDPVASLDRTRKYSSQKLATEYYVDSQVDLCAIPTIFQEDNAVRLRWGSDVYQQVYFPYYNDPSQFPQASQGAITTNGNGSVNVARVDSNTVSGNDNFVFGNSNSVFGDNVTVFGNGNLVTNSNGAAVFGHANHTVKDSASSIVSGNGSNNLESSPYSIITGVGGTTVINSGSSFVLSGGGGSVNNSPSATFLAPTGTDVYNSQNIIIGGYHHNVVSNAPYSVVLGGLTAVTNQYVFIWNGGYGQYADHGQRTFNVNPVDGTDGFYVGENSLTSLLSLDAIAPAFLPENVYTNGDYVMKDRHLYECTNYTGTAGWDANSWQQTSVTGILGNLRKILDEINGEAL